VKAGGETLLSSRSRAWQPIWHPHILPKSPQSFRLQARAGAKAEIVLVDFQLEAASDVKVAKFRETIPFHRTDFAIGLG
jgi:hypothetical protein